MLTDPGGLFQSIGIVWVYAGIIALMALAALIFDLRRHKGGRGRESTAALQRRNRIAGKPLEDAEPLTPAKAAESSAPPPRANGSANGTPRTTTVSGIVSRASDAVSRVSPTRILREMARSPESIDTSEPKPDAPGVAKVQPPMRLASDREFLPAALEILDTPPSPVATAMMLSICGIVVAALAWATIGQLDIHAVAPGRIQPSGRTKIVQPLEAGRVAAVHVEAGETVKAGDVLIELDPTETAADLEALSRELESARAESARRRAAVAAAQGGETSAIKANYPPQVSEAVRMRENGLLLADVDQLRTTVASLSAQLVEREATKSRLQSSIKARKKLLDLSKERVGMREEIRTRGAGSRALIIEAELQYENFATTDASERGQLVEAEASIGSLKKRIEQATAQFIADQTQKLVDIDRRRDRLEQEIIKARSRTDRTRLKAPITGTVQQLSVSTLGQVVSSGQALMSVVPLDAPLEVEVMIANKDIGFVHAGQKATVKIEAFPFTRYGTIDAEVVKVSNDAVEEGNVTGMMDAVSAARAQTGAPSKGGPGQNLVFPATLRLLKSSINVEGKDIALGPGMAVTAEIKTGQRRAISYLLSPLGEILSSSGNER
ncbi:MAG: HlyD family type I secretion periplasmic adaptor subunit [Hyphomicrobiaceae bacterium]